VPFFRLCKITCSITEEIFILNKLVRRFKDIAVLYCVLLKNSIKNANKHNSGRQRHTGSGGGIGVVRDDNSAT